MGKVKFKIINSSDLRTAVKTAFCNYNEFAFYHNIEVKDVKKRFRAFEFNDKKYIAKQTKSATAKEEIANATRAAKMLNGLTVSGLTLNVIEPVLITINNVCYLVSEYKGTTLHEYVYNDKRLPLTQRALMEVFSFLLKKGVMHPGFLPRNIIINQEYLFILDWENVLFSKKAVTNVLRYISVAEFINNWGCLYNRENLLGFIHKYTDNKRISSQTGSFGNEYAFLTGCSNNKRGLKSEIENIILVAESGGYDRGKTYMVPCDLGHLVSDTFPRCIDVFHDLFLFCIQKDEKLLRKYLELMTVYYNIYMKNLNNYTDCDKAHLVVPILLVLDNQINNIETRKIARVKSLMDASRLVEKSIATDSVTCHYMKKNKIKLRNALDDKITSMLKMHLPISQIRKTRINPIRIIETIDEMSSNL